MTEIVAVRGYRQQQPFAAGEYATSGGSASGFDSTIVALDTAAGITGWGEMAPLGSFYAPSFAAGARAGLAELAPSLIGQDAAQPLRVAEHMDAALSGHPYVKSAIDMACWDAAARIRGLPLCTALGGGQGESVELYRSIPPVAPDEAAGLARRHLAEGYRRLQVKVGGEPAVDAERLAAVRDAAGPDIVLFADANAGWSTSSALRFVRLAADIDHVLEQPCETLAECRLVREHCTSPMVLDESIDSMAALLAAWRDGIAGGVTIKIARVGGVTRAAQIRDVAVELGMMVTVEDTGGAGIDTAAMAHLSVSTPEALPHAHRRLQRLGDRRQRGGDARAAGRTARAAGRPGSGRARAGRCPRRPVRPGAMMPPAMPDALILDDRLALADVVAVARDHRPVELAPAARERIAAGRDVTAALLARGERVYGLTTGVGALKRVAVGERDQAAFNRLLLLSHRTGTGPDVAEDVVRAAMLAQLAGFGRGRAGVRPELADHLVAALNAGLVPRVRTTGSLGQSDLGSLADLAEALTGDGDWATELERLGLEPWLPTAKEALAFVNSNAFTLGWTALALAGRRGAAGRVRPVGDAHVRGHGRERRGARPGDRRCPAGARTGRARSTGCGRCWTAAR